MTKLNNDITSLETQDSMRLPASTFEGDIPGAAGVIPDSAFVGLNNDGPTIGFEREAYTYSNRVETPSSSVEGGGQVVNEERRLSFGAAIGADGPYGFVEGSMTRETYQTYETGEDASRAEFDPSFTTSFEAFANTEGDFGIGVEVGRDQKFLSSHFNDFSDAIDTKLRASVGVDSESGLKACVSGEASKDVHDYVTVFGRAAGCLTGEGAEARADLGVRTEVTPIPLEAGLTVNTNGSSGVFGGVSFRR